MGGSGIGFIFNQVYFLRIIPDGAQVAEESPAGDGEVFGAIGT